MLARPLQNVLRRWVATTDLQSSLQEECLWDVPDLLERFIPGSGFQVNCPLKKCSVSAARPEKRGVLAGIEAPERRPSE